MKEPHSHSSTRSRLTPSSGTVRCSPLTGDGTPTKAAADIHVRVVRRSARSFSVHVCDENSWHEQSLMIARSPEAVLAFVAEAVQKVIQRAIGDPTN